MRGELSTPHQRVIIGSLWSTWRLRAPRKQLSLHPTLDCLSQQTPFPSPLPPLCSRFPPHRHSLRCTERGNGTWWHALRSRKMLSWASFAAVWMRKACPASVLPLFSQFHKLERAVRLSGEDTPFKKLLYAGGSLPTYVLVSFSNWSSKASRGLSLIHKTKSNWPSLVRLKADVKLCYVAARIVLSLP